MLTTQSNFNDHATELASAGFSAEADAGGGTEPEPVRTCPRPGTARADADADEPGFCSKKVVCV